VLVVKRPVPNLEVKNMDMEAPGPAEHDHNVAVVLLDYLAKPNSVSPGDLEARVADPCSRVLMSIYSSKQVVVNVDNILSPNRVSILCFALQPNPLGERALSSLKEKSSLCDPPKGFISSASKKLNLLDFLLKFNPFSKVS
jgi:hypothetical protein